MGRLVDRILAIDISLTCWPGQPPAGEIPEILEVGVCPVDVASARVLERQSLIVVPTQSVLSPYCRQVTGITPTDLLNGRSFKATCELLDREYLSQHRVWTSYGNHVRRRLKKQCERMHVHYPFGASHINLKSILTIFRGWNKEPSLPETLARLNLPLTGTRHRAADRAYHCALLMSRLLIEHRMKLTGGTN